MSLLKEFILHLKLDRGASPHTLLAYERDLREFYEFLEIDEMQDQKAIKKLEFHHLTPFVKKISKNKSTTHARKLSALRQFYKFLIREEVLEQNPTTFLESPKKPKPIPKAIAESSMSILLKQVDQGLNYSHAIKPALQARDRALIYLLYASGLRASEILNLQVSHVDLKRDLVRVMGKGRKERLVPFVPKVRELLELYLSGARAQLLPKSDRLFVGHRGQALTRQALWKLLKEFATASNLDRKLHPHLLRHTFATDLLQAGMDLRRLQTLLGHADLQTTQVYTKVAPEHLEIALKKHHPRAKKP